MFLRCLGEIICMYAIIHNALYIELNVVINVLEMLRGIICLFGCLTIQNALYVELNVAFNVLKKLRGNNLSICLSNNSESLIS